MTPIDIFWMFGWFIVGLVVFQVRGIKGYWGEASDLNSILGSISFALGVMYGIYTLPNVVIGYIVESVVIGFLSLLAYLIGANISRWMQFGKLSPRIAIYIISFLLLWVLGQNSTNP